MAQTDRTAGLVGNTAIKTPVRVATTADITLSGEQTIDGVACVSGDRVLVKNQATASENGIWVVDTGEWSRAADFDGVRDVTNGTLVHVTSGTAGAGTVWKQVAADPLTIGTSSLSFSKGLFSGLSAASFTQSGTGAVVRDAEGKAREVVSSADFNDTRGTRNTGLGVDVLAANVAGGVDSTAVGHSALKTNTTGHSNTAVGVTALEDNTDGTLNVAVGVGALSNNIGGDNNVAVGVSALGANTTADGNTAVGGGSLASNVDGALNVAVGLEALYANVTGDANTAIGNTALRLNEASNNSAFGNQALSTNVSGASNVAVGSQALLGVTGTNFNVGVGYQAGLVCTGTSNTHVGTNAGDSQTSGNNNTTLGANAGDTLTSGSNNTLIGANAQPSAVGVSNEVTIGDGNVTKTRIRGGISNATLPAFLAYNSSSDANQTGNGATATVDFDTEVYDQGANFAADTFTAPHTGIYHFDAVVCLTDLTVAMSSFQIALVTTGRTFHSISNVHVETAGDLYTLHLSVDAPMTAGDTAIVQVRITGGAGDTADILGGASPYNTYFSGRMVA